MGFLTQLWQLFGEYSKANPVVGGLVGLFGMSVVSFLLVKCPKQIWGFLKHQLTTTVTFTNEARGYSMENFMAFMAWFNKNHFSALIRGYALDSDYGTDVQLSVGDGNHLFFWKGRPCWVHRERLEKSGTYHIFYSVRITVLGRSRKPIMDMIDTFKYRNAEGHLGVYQRDGSDWTKVASIEKRPLDTVIIEPEILNVLTDSIDHFRADRNWYIERGFPYKLTILLHGIPGTGKSSLIKAIASHYGYNLCLINLSTMSDESLQTAFSTAPSNSIIAIEDFDSTSASHRRKIIKRSPALEPALAAGTPRLKKLKPVEVTESSPGASHSVAEEASPLQFSFLTLSGILNALQGLLPLENKILFLTTNHIELMDEALVRKGRVDKILEIKPMGDAEIRRYVVLLFPELKEVLVRERFPFLPQPGCDVQALYYEYRDDPDGFLKALPRALTLVPDLNAATMP